jgi:hypothetical protein
MNLLVVQTTNGTFNVIAIHNGAFVLEGNLTLRQLRQLYKQVGEVLADHDNK